ncbi:MAG TPA: HlyD family efflux transporter periplasmic adaptor subunit, partial [Polyangiaceae bacterium]|nr:HlyD family efflux transporter periplasmic adaptor subunit [Polyangiaceae bacterium]
SRAGGRVKEVLAHEGDHVEAGQPLVVLETGDLEAQRLMASAQLEQAQAALEKLRAGARPEEIEAAKARAESAAAGLAEAQHGARPEEIKAAQARLDGAESAVQKAKLDVDRLQALFDAGAISRAELDGANTQLQIATSQRDAAKATYTELKNGTRFETIAQAKQRAAEANASAKLVESGARIEDLRAAESVVKAAEGRLAQIDVTIGELTVKAPAKARVETLDLRPGDLVAPTATAAVLLEDDQLYVRVYIPETQLGLVHTGDAVDVFVDSFPNRAFVGSIQHVDMQGQYSPRNLQTADERANQVFAARIGLSGDFGELRAGMAATVREAK